MSIKLFGIFGVFYQKHLRNQNKIAYILIDFNEASEEVKSLFCDLMNKDYIFLQLQAIYNVVKHVPVPCFPNLIKNYIASMREVVEAYKKTVREIRTVQDWFINSYR